MQKQTASRAAFSTVKETDFTITVGSPSFDLLLRNRLEYDRQETCYHTGEIDDKAYPSYNSYLAGFD
jgi:hypothetical protein